MAYVVVIIKVFMAPEEGWWEIIGDMVKGDRLVLVTHIPIHPIALIIAGGALGLALVAFLIYQAVIRDKAFEQAVESVEQVKKELPEQKEKIKETLASVQSKRTTELVHREK